MWEDPTSDYAVTLWPGMAAETVERVSVPYGDVDASRTKSDHAFRVGHRKQGDPSRRAIEHVVTSVRLLRPLCPQHEQIAVRRGDQRMVGIGARRSAQRESSCLARSP
jgi:hypothetical protein